MYNFDKFPEEPKSLIVSFLPQFEFPDEHGTVLQEHIVMVHVREGWVVSVDVERDRKKLWHDAVVGDQGG